MPVYNRPLRLDQVISSQKELGPHPSEGGYGWIVLIGCVFIQFTVPSLITAFGVFLLFDQIENLYHDNEYFMWDHEITLVPIVYVAFWAITDAWCYRITRKCNFPKLNVLCGVCLICGGNLIVWAAELHEPTIILYYFIGGGCAGVGTSLIITQCEYLIRQYFQEKYKIAKNVLYLSRIIGYVVTPLVMGNLIIRHGVLECMIVYQVILGQVIIVAMTFKKPYFIIPETTAYNILDTSSYDDEQLVFNKSTLEVQPSSSNEVSLDEEIREANKKFETFRAKRSSPRIQEDHIEQIEPETSQPSPRSRILQETFGSSQSTPPSPNSIEVISASGNDSFAYDNNINYNSMMNNNRTYLPTIIEETEIPVREPKLFDIAEISQTLRNSTFHKFLFVIFVEKLSHLTFWTLYPSMIYNDVSQLNVHQTITSITMVAIGGLVFTIIWNCLVIPRRMLNVLLSASFFLAAIGFTIIHMAQGKNYIIIGGIITTASLCSIHVLTEAFILQSKETLNQHARSMINLVVGIAILATTILDIEYRDCFEAVSLLQFLVGAVWWTNIIYKKLKKTME